MRIANAINGILVMTTGVVLLASIGTCSEEIEIKMKEDQKTRSPTPEELNPENASIKSDDCPAIAMATIGFYSIVFGFLLTAFELRWGEKYRAQMHKYFGFLFGYFGRMIFILFLATLCLALPSGLKNGWVGYTVGSLTLANGLFNCYVIYYHPDIRALRKGKKAKKKGEPAAADAGGGGVEAGSNFGGGTSSPRSDSTENFSNPYAASGGGRAAKSRNARGTMQAGDHPAYGNAYSTPAQAPAPAPAPAYGGGGTGNAGFDDDNPFADESVTGAM